MPHSIINKKEYRNIHSQLDIPVFLEPWWLDITAKDNWQIINCQTNDKNYFWVFYLRKIRWGSEIISPHFTMFLCPYPIDTNFEKVTSTLYKKLPKHNFVEFSAPIEEGFNLDSFNRSTKVTYRITSKEYSEISSRYSNSLKRNLKKGKDLSLSINDNKVALIKLLSQTFKRKKQSNPYDIKILEQLIASAITKDRGMVITAYDSAGLNHASGFFVWDKTTLYYLIGGIREKPHHSAMSLVLDKAIQIATEKELVFDFEGSMIPGVAEFYRRFGATKKHYVKYNKYKGLLGALKATVRASRSNME